MPEKDSKKPPAKKNWVKDYVVPLLTAFVAVMTAILTFRIDTVKNDLESQRTSITAIQSQFQRDFDVREAERDLSMEVYNAVVSSLQSDNARHQSVAHALVVAMLDSPLRDHLLAVLEDEGSESVSADAERDREVERKFNSDEELVLTHSRPPGTSPDQASVDVFWCEGSQGAEATAESLGVLTTGITAGRVRVRMLPESIRQRPGYRTATGYQIRFEEDERESAEVLKSALDPELSAGEMTLVPIAPNTPTPGYVSVFVCPERIR